MSRPDKIDGLKLWWDADDISTINDGRVVDGSNVYKWADKVGRYVLTNGAGLKGPTYSVGKVNRRNTISFTYFDSTVSTVASLKRLTSFPNTIPPLSGGNYTVFIVCLPNDVRLRPDDTYPTVNDSLVVFNILDSSRAGVLPVDGTVYDRAMYTTTWNNVARVLGVNGDKPTAVIGSNKLTFASIPYSNQNPPALKVGATLSTTPAIPANTTITDITGLTISMSNNALQAPVGGADIGIILQTPNRNTTIGYYESQGGTSYRGFRTDKITDNNESVNSGKLYMYGKATIFNYRFGSNTKKSGFLRDDYFLHDQFRPPVPRYENNVAANTITNPVLTIGAGWSIDTTVKVGSQLNPFEGEMCEFLWYDRLLTDPELKSVESYLKQKWISYEPPVVPSNPNFIITIDTTKGDGVPQFLIPVNTSLTYNYTVYWEKTTDPTINQTLTNRTVTSPAITFPSGGVYKIEISGQFPHYRTSFSSDGQKLIGINNWGNIVWTTMNAAFAGCFNLAFYSATDSPNLQNLTDLSFCFRLCQKFNGNVGNWNVSNVTNMNGMFFGCDIFNQDLNGWDTKNVTNIGLMFRECYNFNGDVSSWKTQNMTDISSAFMSTKFNRDISGWDVRNVTKMDSVFYNSRFNQNINGWDVRKVTSMSLMFASSPFNQNLNGWTILNVGDMSRMFESCTVFNGDITNWNTSTVNSMGQMFKGATSFNRNLSGWCVSQIQQKPLQFDDNTPAWTNQLWRPKWGVLCP